MNRPASISIAGRCAFDDAVRDATGSDLHAASLDTIQVNIGLTCNLACHHCHVVSGPNRDERMTRDTLDHVLRIARLAGAHTIDITGGAPEMNPHFRRFITEARAAGHRVIVRTNLTIMLADGYTDLPEFFAQQGVHLVASLPCYLPDNVNQQRGRHVYEDSIDVIQKLNAVGYGTRDDLPLDLVYNPLGPTLPPAEAALEGDYRRVLGEDYRIAFTRLITITNMPIGRFRRDLQRDGQAADYEQLLRESFNPATVEPLMCRHQLHVSHDGTLHDCDFNYALNLPCDHGVPTNIAAFDADALRHRRIVTGDHCFGCTAGAGSSCGGALA